MKSISKNIFRAYDIRGEYPKEISPDFAYRLGYFFNDFLRLSKISKRKNLRILVDADLRKSSELLKEKLIAGLSYNKNIILDLGQSTTPMFYFGIKKVKADFGIMVTASHLPQDHNGFKIFDKDITAISGERMGKFVKLFEKNIVNSHVLKSQVIKVNLLNEYVDFLVKYFNFKADDRKSLRDIKIAVNDQFGIATPVFKKLLPKLNLPIRLFYEKSNIKFHKIVKNSFDLGVYFDADGDRVVFVNKQGEIISSDIIGPILAQYFAQLNKKAKIVIDETTTKFVGEVVKEHSGEVIYSQIGHTYFKVKMAETKSVFGLEKSGHYYFKDFYFADSGIFTFLTFLKAFIFYGGSLDNLQNDFEKYAIAPEINFKTKNYQRMENALKNKFKRQAKRISSFNGLTMDFNDWRFNIRPSNTEPILRFNMEAVDEKILKDKMLLIKKILKK
jgi:phosphomannomutase